MQIELFLTLRNMHSKECSSRQAQLALYSFFPLFYQKCANVRPALGLACLAACLLACLLACVSSSAFHAPAAVCVAACSAYRVPHPPLYRLAALNRQLAPFVPLESLQFAEYLCVSFLLERWHILVPVSVPPKTLAGPRRAVPVLWKEIIKSPTKLKTKISNLIIALSSLRKAPKNEGTAQHRALGGV